MSGILLLDGAPEKPRNRATEVDVAVRLECAGNAA
jgi:hypothetical protein